MATTVPRRAIMITGASRGIGRAIALELAAAGHDLVLTARSVSGGARFDGTSRTDPLAGMALSGSLEDVATSCRALGSRVATVALDLTDADSVAAAADDALRHFPVIDTLISNAIYQGPGVNDLVDDLSLDLLRRVIEADAVAPLILLQRFLAGMAASGRGVFIHLTSGAASLDPKAPAGAGGWGLAYAMAKGAAHRIAGVLQAEYRDRGLRAYSLNPGHVLTEVMEQRAILAGREPTGGRPEDVAWAAAWLVAGDDQAVALAGGEVVSRDILRRWRDA
ncbi:MAG: SDR family NAD(P)-dependent oxidoreductase [Ilumatobacteraceae bacterium]